jgi:P-type Na+/K+ transporter
MKALVNKLTEHIDICSDKTGTLTMGKMTLKTAWVSGQGTYMVDISNDTNDFYNPGKGVVRFLPKEPRNINRDDPADAGVDISPTEQLDGNQALSRFVTTASLANMAQMHAPDEASTHWHARGSPTEVAIQVFACRFNRNRLDLTGGDAPS